MIKKLLLGIVIVVIVLVVLSFVMNPGGFNAGVNDATQHLNATPTP